MSKFSENLRYLRNKKSISQEVLADDLGITRNKVAAYEDGRAEPNLETLVAYSAYFMLPIDAMIKTDLTKNKDGTYIDIGSNRILFPVIINEDNQDVIEIVSNKASAGYLQGYYDTEYIAKLPTMTLSFLPIGKYRTFPISGDSMAPWVKEGDYVVGRFLENPNLIKNGNCYVILTKSEGLVYKRIFTNNANDGSLMLHSDNKMYRPFEVPLSEILEIWEFAVNLIIGQYRDDETSPNAIFQLLQSIGTDFADLKDRMDKIEGK